MAIFRKIHTQLWSDPFFSELDSEKKLFYVYLLTNEKTKQCGIYEISKKHICFDLNLSLDKVNKLLNFFISKGKIQFSETTNELAMRNWKKYNYSTSPKVVKCIESELKLVKNRVLIEYIYSIDTLSQEEEEKEEEKEEEVLTIENRKLKFIESLKPYTETYSKDMLNLFYLYWTEHGDNDLKMRFEKEKTFGLKQRLERWNKNNFNKQQEPVEDKYMNHVLKQINLNK
jgi:hypothetical protein